MKTTKEYADEVREWADQAVMRHYHGPGQMGRAFDRASNVVGVDRGFLWMLRYRFDEEKLSIIEAYFRLKADYERECVRQERLLEFDRQTTRDMQRNAVFDSEDSPPD